MEAITKFRTDDGREFTLEADALAYEDRCARVAAVMAEWPDRPEGCAFSNGSGYFQLSEDLVIRTRNGLLDIIAETLDHRWVAESRDPAIHYSWVARLLGEGDDHCVGRAWYRLGCVDSQWRLWGQPYFANNPHEGKQLCLGVAKAREDDKQ